MRNPDTVDEAIPDGGERVTIGELRTHIAGLFAPTEVHDAAVTEALFRRAVGGRTWSERVTKDGTVVRVEADVLPDTAAATQWLKARQPEQWAEKRTAEFRVVVARLGSGSEREAVMAVIGHDPVVGEG